MKNLKFRGKIILPTAVLVLLLLAASLIFAIMQFSSFTDYLVEERVNTAANGLREFAEDTRRLVIDVGLQISMDPLMVQALLAEDPSELLRVGRIMLDQHNVTYVTAFNADGIVLARTDEPENFGDVVRTASLLEALEGVISVAYSPVGARQIPIRSSVPVFHEGEIIGGLVIGYALDTPKAVDAMQARFDAEFVVFVGDTSVASTFRRPDGERDIGTTLLPEAVDTVLGRQEELFASVTIAGSDFSAFYLPLRDPEGNVYATIFMGLYLDNIQAQQNFVTLAVAGIGIVGLAVALFVIYRISSGLLAPINRLMNTVSDVSQGKLNINRDANIANDEIGQLTKDVYGLVDILGAMTNDIATFAHAANVEGDIEHRIDSSKYFGGYKEMMDSLNEFIDDFVQNMLDLIGVLRNVNTGDFNADLKKMPGKKAIMNEIVDALISNLTGVSTEISAMIEAAVVKGDLHFQIDHSKYEGGWRDIMRGLNNIAEAVDKPITEIRDSMAALDKGNFDVLVSGDYTGDFQVIKHAVNQTITDLSEYIHEIDNCLGAVASGDLRRKISMEFAGDFDRIKQSINGITDTLYKTMSEISSASDQVLSGAKQISTSAMDMANGAAEQASSVQELNASIDLISQQTKENAESATEANTISNKSTQNAQEGNESMKQMLEAMLQIKESSNNISRIIKVIQDIAFQTNLLSLNAAVEAARAGEHGKGFSVVAEEVRNLASRSQTAATETTGLIEDSITRVDLGSGMAESTAEALDVIVNNANEVLEIINNISASSRDQAEAIGQVSQGLGQISVVVQSNSAISEETAAAAEELSSQAELLRQLVSYFKV